MPKHHITCEVLPRFIAEHSSPEESVFSFSYTVTITNLGDMPAQLISRHWIIVDANGHNEEVKGLGVVGHQPLLKPGESFQYSSGSRLRTASGTMHGSYFFVAENGDRFDADIAMFVLEASETGSGAGLPGRILH